MLCWAGQAAGLAEAGGSSSSSWAYCPCERPAERGGGADHRGWAEEWGQAGTQGAAGRKLAAAQLLRKANKAMLPAGSHSTHVVLVEKVDCLQLMGSRRNTGLKEGGRDLKTAVQLARQGECRHCRLASLAFATSRATRLPRRCQPNNLSLLPAAYTCSALCRSRPAQGRRRDALVPG